MLMGASQLTKSLDWQRRGMRCHQSHRRHSEHHLLLLLFLLLLMRPLNLRQIEHLHLQLVVRLLPVVS